MHSKRIAIFKHAQPAEGRDPSLLHSRALRPPHAPHTARFPRLLKTTLRNPARCGCGFGLAESPRASSEAAFPNPEPPNTAHWSLPGLPPSSPGPGPERGEAGEGRHLRGRAAAPGGGGQGCAGGAGSAAGLPQRREPARSSRPRAPSHARPSHTCGASPLPAPPTPFPPFPPPLPLGRLWRGCPPPSPSGAMAPQGGWGPPRCLSFFFLSGLRGGEEGRRSPQGATSPPVPSLGAGTSQPPFQAARSPFPCLAATCQRFLPQSLALNALDFCLLAARRKTAAGAKDPSPETIFFFHMVLKEESVRGCLPSPW